MNVLNKSECIKGNSCKTPIEKRNKILQKIPLGRFETNFIRKYCMNRRIQAEGRLEI